MRALIIDDDPRMVHLLRTALEGEHFSCESALNGDVALEVLREKSFDLIVLDIEMPGKNGFAVLSSLRAMGIDSLVLVVSAHGLVEDRVKGLDLGADDYLVKNFSLTEFVARVHALMRRKLEKKHNVLSCGGLVMDLRSGCVTIRQKECSFSHREFQILFALLSRKNEVVSRGELADAVWGAGADLKSNALDVHIRTIRKKLGDDARLLQTLRGRGYRLTNKK